MRNVSGTPAADAEAFRDFKEPVMNSIAPTPTAPNLPTPTGRVANGVPPVPASAQTDDGHVVATDRCLDRAALAAITEYESWLRHLR
jgi:hypothetical protein